MDKSALRQTRLAGRAAAGAERRAHADRGRETHLLATIDAVLEAVGARCVASYVSVGTEPATGPLHDALARAGVRVLLPRLRADSGLDLILDDGRRELGAYGIPAPLGPPVDPAEAALWLVPALSVDRRGTRLGRGGGAYDRVLPSDRPAIALLFADELVEELPAEPHDRPVTHAALPSGVVLLTR